MGGIEGIGIGIGTAGTAASAGGNDPKDTKSGLMHKITTLKSQLSELEFQDGKKADQLKRSLEERIERLQKRVDKMENKDGKCQTCENRRYQDGSDDPGVSYKTATKIKPEQAASAVRGHEMEHVYRNRAKAEREDRKVVAQSVTIHTGICPECGKPYVSGGVTKTVTKPKTEPDYNVGIEEGGNKGSIFDKVA